MTEIGKFLLLLAIAAILFGCMQIYSELEIKKLKTKLKNLQPEGKNLKGTRQLPDCLPRIISTVPLY